MNKLTVSIAAAIGLAVSSQGSSPALSGVDVRQDSSRLVTISYTVDQDCIVTVDVLTNGVSIGEANFTNMRGMVNRKVPSGAQTICWQPRDSWADHRVAAGDLSVQVKAWPLCAPPPYMVVDLVRTGDGFMNDGEFIHYFASTNAFPGGFDNRVYKTDTIVMRHIPAAGIMWKMGMSAADETEMGNYANNSDSSFSGMTYVQSEKRHYVMLTNDYWFAIYPITQGQGRLINSGSYLYSNFKGDSGSYYDRASGTTVSTTDRDLLPVDSVKYESIRGAVGDTPSVNWPTTGYDTVGGLIRKLRNVTGGTLLFDLPTEAQWEFACRAGEAAQLYDGNAAFYGGSTISNLNCSALGWIKYNYNQSGTRVGDGANTCYVGRFKPNSWGIYDLVGNVNEFCLDYAADAYSPGDLEIDPRGPDSVSGNRRVIRGSSYDQAATQARSSWRGRISSTYTDSKRGFRVAIPIF